MEATKQFFSMLFPAITGQIEIREIGSQNKQRFFSTVNDLCLYTPPENTNIFLGIYLRKNNKSGKAENCTTTNCLFLDFDKMTLPGVRLNLKKANLPEPSIIISSGNGYHVYWLLKKPEKDVTSFLRQLATKTGADIKSTDKARILRFPDTLNYKYNPPRKCEIYKLTDKRYDLELFQKLFPESKTKPEEIKKVSFPNVNRACVRNMLEGVNAGSRNFALGKITKYFQKKQGFDKDSVKQIVLDWNKRNKPPENQNDLLNSFYYYWKNDYKLLGCQIENPELQATLSRFCDRDKCKMKFWGSKLIYSKCFDLNNRIFNDYKTVSGYEITIYGILSRHPEGLTTSQLISKLKNSTGKSGICKENRRKALKALASKDFIQVINRSRKAGNENLYRIKRQGSFGTGFTILNNGAINGVIDKRITASLLKIYVLLNKFCCKDLQLPSITTLAKEIGLTRSAISKSLSRLEKADYIKRIYIQTEKNTDKLFVELLI